VPDKLPVTDSFMRIEAGPEMRGPAPAPHRAIPLWTVRVVFAGIVIATLGASAPARVGVWIGVGTVVGGALMIGLGLRGRKV
jgi:hypothetical protein